MKVELTDKIKVRVLTLLDRWQEQAEVVRDDMESYVSGYNITKLKISKDVSDMKLTFKNIESIIKELK